MPITQRKNRQYRQIHQPSHAKKQRPKHPCKKYYASVTRTPSARQTKEVDVPDAMPWVEKSAMSTQAKDATTLQLLRARFREPLSRRKASDVNILKNGTKHQTCHFM
jgi:hypothetical protein